MIKNKKNGFSLIELILVMGISSMAFVSLVQWEIKKTEMARAEAAGQQIVEIGDAFSQYIARDAVALAALAPPGNTQNIPFNVLAGVGQNVAGVDLNDTDTITPGFQSIAYIPTTYQQLGIFKTNYILQVRNVGGRLDGLVITDNPVCEKGLDLVCPSANNPVKYDWLGAAMKKGGAQIGISLAGAPNVLSGYAGGWTMGVADFNEINESGKLGYRVVSTDLSKYDAQYLRLDGTSTMRGNLNMGNFNINNVTNINANGWIQSVNFLAGTMNSGTINNTGDIQTTNLFATNDVNANNNVNATNNITALNTMRARDLYLGPTPAAPIVKTSGRGLPNAWLSDLLPKYSSRGIYNVSDGTILAKPNCGAGGGGGSGTPKIEIIPQITYQQARVLGNITPFTSGGGGGTSVSWNLYSHSPLLIYANDLGVSWQARFQTTVYDAGLAFSMTGLAHVYCDFQF